MDRTEPNPPSPEELLLELGWLRQLARALVRDQHAAEDLVQDTVAAALANPPRRGGGRELRPWLAAVARNLAALRHRSSARRTRREGRAGVREQLTPPVELEQAERFQQLAEAIVRLPAPFKEVVLLCFYEGLSVREAARRLDLPLETVRTRRSRAVRMLRDDYQRRYGAHSLLALSGSLLAAGPSVAPFIPIILMKEKLLVPAVAVLAMLAWLTLRIDVVDPNGGDHAAVGAGLAVSRIPDPGGLVSPAGSSPSGQADVRLVYPPAEPRCELVVRYLHSDGRTPFAGATIRASWDDFLYLQHYRSEGVEATTGGDGRCTLAVPPRLAIKVSAARSGSQPGVGFNDPPSPDEIWLEEGERREVDLVASEPSTIEGWVWDEEDRLVPGAEVLAWESSPFGDLPPVLRTRADDRGHFRLDGVGRSALLTARSGELRSQHWVQVQPQPGELESRVPLRIGAVRPLTIAVRTEAGEPVAGAEVRCGRGLRPPQGGVLVQQNRDLFLDESTGAAGEVRMPYLPLAPARIQVRKAGFDIVDVEVDATSRRLEVILQALPRLRGMLLDPDGRPVAGATVTFYVKVKSDRAGRFSVPFPPPTSQLSMLSGKGAQFQVEAPGFEICRVPFPDRATEEELEVRLGRGGALSGSLLDEQGSPFVGAWLEVERSPWLKPEDPEPERVFGSYRQQNWVVEMFGFPTWKTDGRGRFHLPSLARDLYRLRFYDPRTGRLLALAERRSDQGGVSIRIGEGLEAEVILEGTVTERGTRKPIPFVSVRANYVLYSDGPGPRTDSEGRYQLAGFRPGEHAVYARRPGYREAESTAKLPGPGVWRQDFELVPCFEGALRVVDTDGNAVFPVALSVLDSQGKRLMLHQGTRGSRRVRVEDSGGVGVDDLPASPATVQVEVAGGEAFLVPVDWSTHPAGEILVRLPWSKGGG